MATSKDGGLLAARFSRGRRASKEATPTTTVWAAGLIMQAAARVRDRAWSGRTTVALDVVRVSPAASFEFARRLRPPRSTVRHQFSGVRDRPLLSVQVCDVRKHTNVVLSGPCAWDYGSEGWGFESLRARPADLTLWGPGVRPCPLPCSAR